MYCEKIAHAHKNEEDNSVNKTRRSQDTDILKLARSLTLEQLTFQQCELNSRARHF